MQVFLKALLFFVLLSTGACLDCETCVKISNQTSIATNINCNGPMKNCSTNKKTCSIIHTEHNLDGATEHIVEKSCDYSKICTLDKVHINVGKGKHYRSSIVCCNGKNCPKDVPPISPGKTTPNGKECLGCFAWSETCQAKTVKCTGSDTHCINIRSKRKNRSDGKMVDVIIKGCTSQFVCVSVKKDKTPLFTGEVDEIECSPKVSKGSQLTSFLLPTVSGLLLMKIFG